MRAIRFGPYSFNAKGAGFSVLAGEKVLLECPERFLAGIRSDLRSNYRFGSLNLKRRIVGTAYCAPGYTVSASENGVALSGRLENAEKSAWRLSFTAEAVGLGVRLEIDGCDEVQLLFDSPTGEGFYGFGEQFMHFDMRGRRFCLCTGEQGIGRGAQPLSTLVNIASPGAAGDGFTTYAPMPVFVTSAGRAFAFSEHTIYHMDICKSRRNRVAVTAAGGTLSGHLFHGQTPLELIEKHTAVTGRLRPLPDFAYGTVLGLRGGREAAEKVLAECLRRSTPVTALWIEDWQGRRGKNGGPPLWWKWLPDETLYPDFKNWARSLKARGIALLGYANPFLSLSEDNPLYMEGWERGYFVKNPDGTDLVSDFFTGKEYQFVMVDLTNPQAYAWLKERMKTGMADSGLSGWMADYGEYVPLHSASHEPNAVTAHCATPVLWQRLGRELIDETGRGEEFFLFSRSGGAGSNRYAVSYWAGDQTPTFDRHDGLASSVTGILTGGISGMSINHSDIGGFTTLITPVYKLVRTKEVMLRWMEYAAFTPTFRTHDGSYSSALVYQFYDDEEGFNLFARMARIHHSLKWYLKLLEEEACGRGYPMMRALWLHYPEDPACRNISHQYLLGADLLVSPVIKKGADSVVAYVPEGEWENLFTGETYQGKRRHTLKAPLGTPPVLVRRDSRHYDRLTGSVRGV